MREFMVLIHGSEAAGSALTPAETLELLQRQAQYAEQLRAAAAWVDGERLRPSAEGRRVRRVRRLGDASVDVEAGPFGEPTLEAYYVVRARSRRGARARGPLSAPPCRGPGRATGHERPPRARQDEPKGAGVRLCRGRNRSRRTLLDGPDGSHRRLGSLDAAEEAFQEAVLAALPSWRDGLPVNPAAWLTTAAKNHARDAARHQRIVDTKSSLLSEHDVTLPELRDSFSDEQLRLIFTCCHPALSLDSQVALTLKVVAGLTTEEIARAFVCPEKTISQRITRAKGTIEERQVPYEVPERLELPKRLASVLAVVYLVFNEGHTTRDGSLMRLDLQIEALRLARQLCDLLPNESDGGDLRLLSEQDRSLWDGKTIKEGLLALQRARRLGAAGPYVIQAEISACHATAPSWEATDWGRILRCYDELLARSPSPVVALNRSVAVCMRQGAAAALEVLGGLEPALSSYHLFFALRADFRRRAGQDARDDYERALCLTCNESERRFLRRKIDELGKRAM